jgi:L,D-transpeptidase catalytic domain
MTDEEIIIMVKYLKSTFIFAVSFLFSITVASAASFSSQLCKTAHYSCLTVQRGQTWNFLWPKADERELIQRINRINLPLHAGMTLAIPNDMQLIDILKLAPFPEKMTVGLRKTIVVDPNLLAWAAYDSHGDLVKWGPASVGRGFCSDEDKKCKTPFGVFTIFAKKGPECVSSKFPVGKGGAPMPWCMFFHDGYALHGSPEVPGYNASHGCVRMFTQDAKWLNQSFIDLGSTRVMVKHYEKK